MSVKEKKLVIELRDAADAYLAAKNHAERYFAAPRLGKAIHAFTKAAVDLAAKRG